MQTEMTEVPVCPHCGFEDHNWWTDLGRGNDGDEWEWTCECGAKVKISSHFSRRFTTIISEDRACPGCAASVPTWAAECEYCGCVWS